METTEKKLLEFLESLWDCWACENVFYGINTEPEEAAYEEIKRRIVESFKYPCGKMTKQEMDNMLNKQDFNVLVRALKFLHESWDKRVVDIEKKRKDQYAKGLISCYSQCSIELREFLNI